MNYPRQVSEALTNLLNIISLDGKGNLFHRLNDDSDFSRKRATLLLLERGKEECGEFGFGNESVGDEFRCFINFRSIVRVRKCIIILSL